MEAMPWHRFFYLGTPDYGGRSVYFCILLLIKATSRFGQ